VRRLALYTTVNYDGQLSRNMLKAIISRVPLHKDRYYRLIS